MQTFPYPGTLYRNPISCGVPVWSQPGGPGTLVFPQQSLGEHNALYSFECGHWFNIAEVYKVFDPVTGLEAALVCCPQCSYVQRVIEPYAEFDDYVIHPILVA